MVCINMPLQHYGNPYMSDFSQMLTKITLERVLSAEHKTDNPLVFANR